jgi:hypothetical protein
LRGALDYLIPTNKKSWHKKYLISAARTLVAIKILLRARTYLIYLGVNNDENARIISKFILEESREKAKAEDT